MKNLILIIAVVVVTSSSHAQSDSGYAGLWKAIVHASNKLTVPTFFMLNSDGTYNWGIDSAAYDPLKNATAGTWSISNDGEIKLIPSDTAAEIRYYQLQEKNLYKYKYSEKNGKKEPVYMLEMDFYIEKISPDIK